MFSGVDALDDAAPRLLVRTVASADRGSGHAMRCLAIAEAWMERGGRVVARYAAGLDAHRARYGEAGIGDEDGSAAAHAHVIDGVPLDLDEHASAATLVFDDNGHHALPEGALVLNPNAHASAAWYDAARHPSVLLGPRFAPLRARYREGHVWRAPSNCERLLVTFGGADPTDRARRLVAALNRPLPHVSAVDVVVGPACPFTDYSAFEGAAWHGPRVVVHRAPPDLVALMREARLVLSSCGSTVWELCALRRAFVAGAAVPYEEPLAAWLGHELGAEAHADWMHTAREPLGAKIASLCADGTWLDATALRAAHLCDGRGAVRVVDALWSAPRTSTPAPNSLNAHEKSR